MNIYFASSICGGRDDSDLYRKIIEHLTRYGPVLTEHIGDPSVTEEGEHHLDDGFIYNRDLEWLRAADIIIAEVSMPSLGVGYEIATAVQWHKKILCLYRPKGHKKLSAMIAGCPGATTVEYGSFEEAADAIDSFLNNERLSR
jgi:hypothetical protein